MTLFRIGLNTTALHFVITACLTTFSLYSSPGQAQQQPSALNPSLHEQVLMVPKGSGVFSTELEVTVFKPEGDGPFPLAIINHGKESGDSKFQARYRPWWGVRYFMTRGYAVIVPMRQGFSKSSGQYLGAGCNVSSNGDNQAEDVAATLAYFSKQSWADANRVIVLGQSHGGWTSLAYGSQNPAGVKGIVNFAGGLRQPGCGSWEYALFRGAANYGAISKLPQLWFYGDNDSYFSPFVFKGMHKAFTDAGGKARLIEFGTFDGDAHGMFGREAGLRIWQPRLTEFLQEIELPHAQLSQYLKYRGSYGDKIQ